MGRVGISAICGAMLSIGLGTVHVSAAHAGRTPLHAVDLGSSDGVAIVKAERAWVMQDPAMHGTALEPLFIKRNDKYAYLGARVIGAPIIPYIVAVLELKGGRWVSTGDMALHSKPTGSVREICGYGDGVHREVFRECK